MMRGVAAAWLVASAALLALLAQRAWAKNLGASLDPALAPYLSGLPPVDQAQVSILGTRVFFDDTKRTADGGMPPRPFPLLPWREFATVRAVQTVHGIPAVELAALWRAQVFGAALAKPCHKPAYGVRFLFGDKQLLETSLSAECRSFYVPVGHDWTWHGWDTSTPQAKALWERLRLLFPQTPPP